MQSLQLLTLVLWVQPKPTVLFWAASVFLDAMKLCVPWDMMMLTGEWTVHCPMPNACLNKGYQQTYKAAVSPHC
jgi:hypothetical protein